MILRAGNQETLLYNAAIDTGAENVILFEANDLQISLSQKLIALCTVSDSMTPALAIDNCEMAFTGCRYYNIGALLIPLNMQRLHHICRKGTSKQLTYDLVMEPLVKHIDCAANSLEWNAWINSKNYQSVELNLRKHLALAGISDSSGMGISALVGMSLLKYYNIYLEDKNDGSQMKLH
jgi:hypothetical protein